MVAMAEGSGSGGGHRRRRLGSRCGRSAWAGPATAR